MKINKSGLEISAGLGWMSAIDNFLDVVFSLEFYHDFHGSVRSIKTIDGSLQVDMNLPVDEAEQAFLQSILNDWVHRICDICGKEGAHYGDRTRCQKHKDSAPDTLSSVKHVGEPGIPTFRKGAFIVSQSANEQFLLIEYGYPDRFMPTRTGTLIDQTTTPFHQFCDRTEGRRKVRAAKFREDIHLLVLDVHSYNELYADIPRNSNLALINAFESKDQKALQDILCEDFRKEKLRLTSNSTPPPEHHYVTGLTALALPDPNKGFGLINRPKDPEIAGIHLESTWELLHDEGLYKSVKDLKEVGAILPSPLVAGHERALFDLLYTHIQGPQDTLPLKSGFLHLIDVLKVQAWIDELVEPDDRKALLLDWLERVFLETENSFS